MSDAKGDIEAGRPSQVRPRLTYASTLLDQGVVTPEILKWRYKGQGTEEKPFLVTWIDNDPRNPQEFSNARKWFYTFNVAFSTLAVAFVSSAFSGATKQIIEDFHSSSEVVTLGLSLYVLGFAVGPLIWAPLSELYGRQIIFAITFGALTAFTAGGAGSQNVWTLIILRFFAGAFGSSPLTNSGGVIADMFSAEMRGTATFFFALAPFAGPALGPVIGGFVGETVGWRWVMGVLGIFSGVMWIVVALTVPETYAPVLLKKRAAKLSQITGKVYRSKSEAERGAVTLRHALKTSLVRPWVLLFQEPIVMFLSIYIAIIYGTLYMLFGAFPIVFQEERGWSQGIGGLAFLGLTVGMAFSVLYNFYDSRRYRRISRAHKGFAPPEARLPAAMVGGVFVTIGLIWFAWTDSPSIHYMAPIAAGVPFGFGMVLVFVTVINYLIDAYTIFAASVLAANSVIRSIFGAAFPLFTEQMYHNLGIHWATMIPAFLALICVPMPFILYKYGPAIRQRCKFAAQADAFMKGLQQQEDEEEQDEETPRSSASPDEEKEIEREREERNAEVEREIGREEHEAYDYSYDVPRVERMHTNRSTASSRTRARRYEGNPYDIDRVNTINSFREELGLHTTRSTRSATAQ